MGKTKISRRLCVPWARIHSTRSQCTSLSGDSVENKKAFCRAHSGNSNFGELRGDSIRPESSQTRGRKRLTFSGENLAHQKSEKHPHSCRLLPLLTGPQIQYPLQDPTGPHFSVANTGRGHPFSVIPIV